jgi:RNA polymerase sigma factor (sigma-70 family)
MSTPTAEPLARHLRRLLPPAGLAVLTDRQLLDRFAAGRDEAAFAALVERHGRLVLGVCRRLLGDLHDAEDVFQATFLVLARKSDAIRRRDALGSWLHGVAARLARKARVRRERRRAQGPCDVSSSADVPDAVAREEVYRVIDEELRRLPAHYRKPLVLCYLEGKSRQEVAAALGCTEGAVKGKLERGRELLRARLVRRGVAAVPAALAALEQPAGAAVPAAWTAAAVRAAITPGSATGTGAALAEGLLRSMFAAKMKMMGGLLLLCFGVGLGLAAWPLPAAAPAEEKAPMGPPGKPLPSGAVARLGDAPLRQEGPILFVGFARKGQLVTAQQGFTAYCATCHAEPFNVMEDVPLFKADAFRVWDLERGREVSHFGRPHLISQPGVVRGADGALAVGKVAARSYPGVCMALAPDGQALAVAGPDDVVRLWEVAAGRVTHQIAHKGCMALAFTADGKQVGICDASGALSLWELATNREVRRVAAEPGWRGAWGDALAFSPDGKGLAMSSTSQPRQPPAAVVRLLDIDGKERCRLENKAPGSPALAFSPDSRVVAYAATDGKVRLADAATGKEVRTLGNQERTSFLAALAFSPDGKTLATRGYDRAVRLWDVESGREVRQLAPSNLALQTGAVHYFGLTLLSPAGTLAFSPDGRFLAAADPAGRARLWETATGKEVHTGHAGAVTAIDFTADGRAIRSLGTDHTVWQWRPGSGEETARFQLPAGAADAALSPAGNLAAFSIARDKVQVWDVDAGREICQLDASEDAPCCVGAVAPGRLTFSPDGKLLARHTPRGVVQLWEAASGRPRHTLIPPGVDGVRVPAHWSRVATAFSPDGTLVAAFDLSPAVCVWNAADGRLRRRLAGLESAVTSLAFAPDGRSLALGYEDGTVSSWELASGGRQTTLRADGKDPISVLAYAPDGKVLAGTQERQVCFWDVRTGEKLRSRQGHSLDVVTAAFAPDGRTLVSGSKDSTALVWDVVGLRPEPKPLTLDGRDLAACWNDLLGDAASALKAMNRLGAAPRQAVVLLNEHLRPAVPADGKRIARLLADLDHTEFGRREQATAELEKLGELARPALRRALDGNPPPEARRRLEALLEKLHGLTLPPEALRLVRAVELLEQMNTPEARALLERLAGGAAEAPLTRQAGASLQRLRTEYATPP